MGLEARNSPKLAAFYFCRQRTSVVITGGHPGAGGASAGAPEQAAAHLEYKHKTSRDFFSVGEIAF